MNGEMQMQYDNLLVHHLERTELEHELTVRAVQFDNTDTHSALRRRLRDRLREEKDKNTKDIDFVRCDKSADEEIKTIDDNIKDIRDILENKKKFEGIRDSLKTRLIHYFARCVRAQDFAEEDVDLEDLDKLKNSIRELVNTYFSPFSPNPTIQAQMIAQIANSLSNLNVQTSPPQAPEAEADVNSEIEERGESDIVPLDPKQKNQKSADKGRKLKSVTTEVTPFYPYVMNQYGMPYCSRCQCGRNLGKSREINPIPMNISARHREPRSDTTESVSEKSSSPSPTRYKSKSYSRKQISRKFRPVSDWNLRYDGKDQGQGLMKFIREVEFIAKSERMSNKDLFRSAIHLFGGVAKTWFMAGVDNEDFVSWKELVRELKKEFLSPDHDHVGEIRAGARKQGSKEKFQDYFFDMQKIFNSFTKPYSEAKKFDIVFRNMRSDYKGHAVASNINNLADLKTFGRRLDATFWFKYNTHTEESGTRNRANVNELRTGAKSKNPSITDSRPHKTRNFYRSQKAHASEDPEKYLPRESNTNKREDKLNPNSAGLNILVENYLPPKDGMCFNCRLPGHRAQECRRPPHKFCNQCGFHNVDTKNCPYCAKNAL